MMSYHSCGDGGGICKREYYTIMLYTYKLMRTVHFELRASERASERKFC